MNPFRMAEELIRFDCDNMSASEQMIQNKRNLEKAGALSEKHKKQMDDAIKMQRKAEKKAAASLLTKMILKSSDDDDEDDDDDNDQYSDGNQSPLKGMDSMELRTQWASGMDFDPDELSEFYHHCFIGNTNVVRSIIDKADDKTKLLEKRESMMRFSALFCVVQGAKMEARCLFSQGNSRLETIKLLIKSGAKVNAKDVAGYSVLYHCFCGGGNQQEKLELAKELIAAGADVNLQNRFGCTPLHENVMVRNYELLQVLVENGADPSIKCNDGIAPNSMVLLFPKAQKIFSEAGFHKKRKEEKENKHKCGNCGKLEANKWCSKCSKVFYCNRECQKENWKQHKKVCGSKEKRILRVDTKDNMTSGISINWRSMTCNDNQKKKKTKPAQGKTFIVKVQIPLNNPLGLHNERGSLLVYDKARSFQHHVGGWTPGYDAIVQKIKDDGVMGIKGYFKATFDADDFLCVEIDNITDPQSW